MFEIPAFFSDGIPLVMLRVSHLFMNTTALWAVPLALAASLLLVWAVNVVWIKPRRFIAHFAKQGVPNQPFRPLLGQLPEIMEALKSDDCWAESRASVAQLGKVFTSCFGPLPRLVICDAELAHEVLTKKAKYYHKTAAGRRILGPLLGNGLFFSEGEFHRRQRALITPAFHFMNLQKMLPLMVHATDGYIDKWAESENPFNAHRAMSALTLNIIASAALGSDFLETPEVMDVVYNAFTSVLEDIQKRNLSLIGILPIVNKLPTTGYRRIQKGVADIQRVAMASVHARRSGQSRSLCEGKDLLDLLLEARDEEGNTLSEELIKDSVMTFMLAGHETTAIMLTWALAELGRRPDIWARCRDEVDSVLGSRAPDEASIKELKYLEAVLLEACRFYPPAPFIRREATHNHVIGRTNGIKVPKDTFVSINLQMLHHSPDYWSQPDRFDPERFMPGAKRPVPGSFGPFGDGPRRCIGRGFAIMEGKVILARIFQRFDLELVPNQTIVPELGLTIRPKYGVMMVPKLRQRA